MQIFKIDGGRARCGFLGRGLKCARIFVVISYTLAYDNVILTRQIGEVRDYSIYTFCPGYILLPG